MVTTCSDLDFKMEERFKETFKESRGIISTSRFIERKG